MKPSFIFQTQNGHPPITYGGGGGGVEAMQPWSFSTFSGKNVYRWSQMVVFKVHFGHVLKKISQNYVRKDHGHFQMKFVQVVMVAGNSSRTLKILSEGL